MSRSGRVESSSRNDLNAFRLDNAYGRRNRNDGAGGYSGNQYDNAQYIPQPSRQQQQQQQQQPQQQQLSPTSQGYTQSQAYRQQQQQQQQQQPQPGPLDMVIALFDYNAGDRPHSLSLHQGDVISVYSKLASGWWEGVNSRGQRGWFPSNYTQQPPTMAPPPQTPQPAMEQQQQQQQQQQQHHETLHNLTSAQSSSSNFGLSRDHGELMQQANDSVDPLTSSSTLASPNINDFAVAIQVGDESDDRHQQHQQHQQFQQNSGQSSVHESRKNSAVSYASSTEDKQRVGSGNTHTGSMDGYKLVDTTDDEYRHPPSHWVPGVLDGKVMYTNPSRKHVTEGLPFEQFDAASETERVPKTMPIPGEFVNQAYNDAVVPVLNESETQVSTVDTGSRASLSSKTSGLSAIPTDSWSALMGHLKSTVQVLNEVYANWNEPGLAGRYNDVSNTIQTINLMAGIPQSTLPSAATDPTIAKVFRRIMNTLSKAGLICDICAMKRSKKTDRRPSGTSNSDGIEQSVPISNDEFSKMCESLVADAETFVDEYKRLLREEEIRTADDEDRIEPPPASFNVKQFKDGVWSSANLSRQGNVNNDGASSAGGSTTGLGISAPSPSQSLFQLESFDATVPVDVEAVAALREKLELVQSTAQLVDRLMAAPSESSVQGAQSRGKSLKSHLHNLANNVNIALNLVESLELSIYYGGRRRTLLHKSDKAPLPPTRDAFTCLKLLYQFLDSKQDLYDAVLNINQEVASSLGLNANNDLVASLSNAMDKLKVAEVLTGALQTTEGKVKALVEQIKDSLSTITDITQTLAEERLMMINYSQQALERQPSTAAASVGAQSGSSLPSRQASQRWHSAGQLTTHSQASLPQQQQQQQQQQAEISRPGSAGEVLSPVPDAPPTPSVTSTHRDESLPEFLQLEYGDEIIYDRQGEIRGGTIRALIEQLTHHNRMGAGYNNAFLLTFRSFSDAPELFELLKDRYAIQAPAGLTQEEYNIWVERKQLPVRVRVVNILKTWIEYYWLEDDFEDQGTSSSSKASVSSSTSSARNTLLQDMLKFAHQLKNQNFKNADALIKLIEQRLHSKQPSFMRRLKPNNDARPAPIVPKNIKKAKVIDIDAREMARQLAIREFNLYKVITPQECLNRGCSSRSNKAAGSGSSQRIGEFINNSNHLTNWVSSVILKSADPKKRAQTIKYFIDVADICRETQNFSSMTAIISSLFSSTIHRMKKTWELVPSKSTSVLDGLNKLMNSSRNFNEYRDLLSITIPPCVPFFGVYLTDLTFTEDGNPDFLSKESRVINFAKRSKLASTIESIRSFQRVPFNFEEVPEIQEMLRHGFESAPPIDEQYDTSLTMEPKSKPGNDKVTMLLQENGIL